MERNAISAWRTSVLAALTASGACRIDEMASTRDATFPVAARRPTMVVVMVSGSILYGQVNTKSPINARKTESGGK